MSIVRRLVPAPLLSCGLFALWVALSRTRDAVDVALGLALGLVVPVLVAYLRPTEVRVRRPLVVVRFVLAVCRDVVTSGLEVAWGILQPHARGPKQRFVTIPLDLRSPPGLAALAIVTTIVPGTVWSELALDRSAVLLHVWDVDDEEVFIAHYKRRYEAPLREIFG